MKRKYTEQQEVERTPEAIGQLIDANGRQNQH